MPELERRRWRVLVVASVGVFMTAFTASVVSVALPVIGPHLHLSYSEALWVQAAYVLAFTVIASPVGRLADMHGPLRLYTLGVLFFTASSVAAALSPSGLFLVMARGFQGVGGAAVLTSSPAIVTMAFPPAERGRALGFNIMAATIGFALGPPLGGLLASHLGWRWIFLIGGPIAVLVLLANWDLLGAERRDRTAEQELGTAGVVSRRIDGIGAVLLGMTLAALFVPLSFSPIWGWRNGPSIGLLASAVILGTLFVIVERRTKDPVIDLRLFRDNRVFAGANSAGLLYFVATWGVPVFAALFLEIVQGHSAQRTGLVLLAQSAVMGVFVSFAGRLADRVGPFGLAATGLVLVAAGVGQLALVSSSAPLWRFIVALGTVGLGQAVFSPPNMSAIMGSVGRSKLGVASGVMFTTSGCGQGLSIAVLGAIAASKLGPTGGRVILLGETASVSSTRAFAAGFREAMLVGAGFALAAALASLARDRKPDRPELA